MLALLRFFRQQASARDRAHCARSREIQTGRSHDGRAAQENREGKGRPPARTEDTSRCRHSLAARSMCSRHGWLAPVPTTIAACVGRALRDSIERAHDVCMRATEHLSIAIRARPTLREVGPLYAAIRIPVPVGRHIVDVHPAPS